MLSLNYYFDFDSEYDILYLKIADNSQSYGDKVVNGINIFRDLCTDEITGLLIFGFTQKLSDRSLPNEIEGIQLECLADIANEIQQ